MTLLKRFATLIILTLMFLPLLNFVSANPEVYANMPKLKIDSPVQNTAYNTNVISLDITGQVRHDQLIDQAYQYFSCNLDGFNFNVKATYNSETSDDWVVFNGKINLIELSDGQHSVSVNHISASQIASMSYPSVSFTITNSSGSSMTAASAPEFIVSFGDFRCEPLGKISYTYPVPWAKITFKSQQYPNQIGGQKTDLYYYVCWKPHSNSSWYSTNPIKVTETPPFFPLMLVRGEMPNEPHVSGLVDVQIAARAVSITEESVYVSEKSEWSNTQTIGIPTSSDYANETPALFVSSNLNIVLFSIVLMLPLIVAISLLFYRRHRKTAKT
jgi:hypothetical protein